MMRHLLLFLFIGLCGGLAAQGTDEQLAAQYLGQGDYHRAALY